MFPLPWLGKYAEWRDGEIILLPVPYDVSFVDSSNLLAAKIHDQFYAFGSSKRSAEGCFVRDAAELGDDCLADFVVCHRQSIAPAQMVRRIEEPFQPVR